MRPAFAVLITVMGIYAFSDVCAASGLGEPVDVEFTAEIDGSKQRYVRMFPAGFEPNKPHHLMIALHGHGSDRWQYATSDIAEARGARETAAKHEMIFVCPDYRAKTSWMGPKAEADTVQIIRALKKEFKIGKVFVVGASMGGSSALTFAVLHPDLVDGVVSQNGTANHLEYRNFQDAIAESFGGTKQQVPLEYKKRSAEYWPEKFNMPVAFTVGGKDESVPPHSVLRLADVLQQMGRSVLLIHRPETGHNTSYEDTLTAYEWVVNAALN